MESRLTELEIRYSHLERLVDELNRVVFEQGKTIDLLRLELLRLRSLLEESGEAIKDEKPPHY
ncbi:SlyX family protein [Pendulispora albinea]|uniref:SlyX family protein n=1 Tax=Pendulispora albinea TaxID=2741071 RepID=A0ABZ2M404_9BACT